MYLAQHSQLLIALRCRRTVHERHAPVADASHFNADRLCLLQPEVHDSHPDQGASMNVLQPKSDMPAQHIMRLPLHTACASPGMTCVQPAQAAHASPLCRIGEQPLCTACSVTGTRGMPIFDRHLDLRTLAVCPAGRAVPVREDVRKLHRRRHLRRQAGDIHDRGTGGLGAGARVQWRLGGIRRRVQRQQQAHKAQQEAAPEAEQALVMGRMIGRRRCKLCLELQDELHKDRSC